MWRRARLWREHLSEQPRARRASFDAGWDAARAARGPAAPTLTTEQVEQAARLLGLPEWDEEWDEAWRREEWRRARRDTVRSVLDALGIEVREP